MRERVSFAIEKILSSFNSGHERTVNARKNILMLFFIKGVSVIINLLMVPLTINYINPERYGIWLTLFSVISWFSFFDIGFANGLRNRFAEAKASGNIKLARIYVSTTYAMLGLIFTIVWLVFSFGYRFLNWSSILNAPLEMNHELSKLSLIVFSFFCMNMVLMTVNTVLIADQKPARAAFFDMIAQLLSLTIIVFLVRNTEGSIIKLGFALGIAPVLVFCFSSIWFYSKDYRHLIPSVKLVRFRFAKRIMNLGAKFFLVQIAVIMIYQTNNIIIAHVCVPEDVAVFNIAYKYLGIAYMIFSILLNPFWSAITEAFTKGELNWIRTSVSNLKITSYFIIIFVVVLLTVSPLAYKLWIGEALSIPFKVSLMVGFYVVFQCFVIMNTQVLNGMGKMDVQLIAYVTGASLHIPVALFLGRSFGVEGVVFSAAFFCAIIAWLSNKQVNAVLNERASGIWDR